MYESFFGLTERPFTLRPDPAFLYLSHQHALALSMLEFGLTGQAGFVVVTGEVGAGKTTLIRHFLDRDNREATIGVISNTHAGFGDILQWVCEALNIEAASHNRTSRYQAFTRYLAQQYGAGQQVVLIVDEAQNLNIAALEDLRLLSNIDIDRDHTLQIILIGQPELMGKLKRPELRQFAQRISVHYHLSPLTYRESCAYIRHRLAVAGATKEIFDSWAMAAVYYFADGVPRVMNSICDMAMVYAYAAGEHIIDVDTIFSIVQDRERNGIQALAKRSSEITRDALIGKALQSFDHGDHTRPVDQEACRIVGPASPGTPPMDEAPPLPQPISVDWHGDERPTAMAPDGADRSLPPIVAVYLPDEGSYRDVAPGQRRPRAFHWLRRHLGVHR
jgi:general secretion pathway protein A